jgi:uncharacterized protein
MSLWIDLDNSPHVHFFAPIIRNLDREGVKYFITIRSFSQTEELARSYGFDFVTIGTHRARHHVATRVGETTARACKLAPYVWKRKATAAVSHNSRALLLASYFLNIPAMTLYDYEFAFSAFSNRVSQKVVVPSEIPVARLLDQGLRLDKLVRYPGLKEEVYVYDFQPKEDILSELDLDPARQIITLRPPQTWAHYHNTWSEVLLDALIRRLGQEQSAQVMVLCRTAEQADAMSHKYGLDSPPFRVLRKAVDGLSLMWYSDAIFSGGGTMVREAALLGLNAHSIFAGKLGAADAALERQGKLKMIREVSEIDRLSFEKRKGVPQLNRSSETRDFVCEQVVRFAQQNQKRKLENVLVREPQTRIPQF